MPAFELSKTRIALVTLQCASSPMTCVPASASRKKSCTRSISTTSSAARLFEAITHLPEYGLTRADERLVARPCRRDHRSAPAPGAVIELGSGTGQKTRHILEASGDAEPCDTFPSMSLRKLWRVASAICRISPKCIRSSSPIWTGWRAAAMARPGEKPALVLFLGSTIGNFERPCALEFLRDLRRALQPGDSLLLGADLVKDRDRMLVAYDDPTGVTGAFNLNLLGRVNRELECRFRPARLSSTRPAGTNTSAASKCTCARASTKPLSSPRRDLTVRIPARRDHLDRVVAQVPALPS